MGTPIDGTEVVLLDDEGQETDILGELRPRAVQIFTVSRRPALMDVRPVSATRLKEIGCVLRARTGIDARVFA